LGRSERRPAPRAMSRESWQTLPTTRYSPQPRAGFRIEGKEALRAFLTNLWQNYPTRQNLIKQVTYRVFQEGNVVVRNAYNDQTYIDKNGGMSRLMQRNSQTWVKTGGRWLLVDQHNSGMPGTP